VIGHLTVSVLNLLIAFELLLIINNIIKTLGLLEEIKGCDLLVISDKFACRNHPGIIRILRHWGHPGLEFNKII
jgi:hypothetical protein